MRQADILSILSDYKLTKSTYMANIVGSVCLNLESIRVIELKNNPRDILSESFKPDSDNRA
jgi:hypothetical protein